MATTYQSPAVYIEEVPAGPQPIAGGATDVAAILANTLKGPSKPTRVTGWRNFVDRFGGPRAGSHSASAVYGFFENGGRALYVVRVDPSSVATWQVNAIDGTELFTVTASSAGTWANDLDPVFAPDTNSAVGSIFFSSIVGGPRGGGAGPTFTPLIDLASTSGLAVGDTVDIIAVEGTTDAEVTEINENNVVRVSSGTDLGGGRTLLAVALQTDEAQPMRLTAAGSFYRGDLVRVVEADGTRGAARLVTDVVKNNAGALLSLDGGTQAASGAALATRRTEFPARIAAPSQSVNEADLSATGPYELPTDGVRVARSSQGLTATLNAGVYQFPRDVSGEIHIEGDVAATAFTISYPAQVLDEEGLTERFGFVPVGGELLLEGAGAPVTITRTASSFSGAAGFDTFESTSATFVLPGNGVANPQTLLRSPVPIEVDDFIEYESGSAPLRVVAVTAIGNDYLVSHDANLPAAPGGSFPVQRVVASRVEAARFTMSVERDGNVVEKYDGLSRHPDHPNYAGRDGIVNELSATVRISDDTLEPVTMANQPASHTTTAGTLAVAGSADYRSGLERLEIESEPAVVFCPDALTLPDDLETVDVYGAVTTHCENFRRFAVIDSPDLDDDQELRDWKLKSVSSMFAAAYAPHVRIRNLDPSANERFINVPPSGFVAGVMARTDGTRGVWKAPANEEIKGILGPKTEYSLRRQDALNPAGVNLIRTFPGRGTRVWGARTATDDSTWRYVNVRRLFNFIENSIERGTQWVVFEPNDARTWLRVQVSVENFLNGIWRAGGLLGDTAEEAYSVSVGLGKTMTETDIDLGLIVIEVAVRPVKPAEFVVFRFSHKRPEK